MNRLVVENMSPRATPHAQAIKARGLTPLEYQYRPRTPGMANACRSMGEYLPLFMRKWIPMMIIHGVAVTVRIVTNASRFERKLVTMTSR